MTNEIIVDFFEQLHPNYILKKVPLTKFIGLDTEPDIEYLIERNKALKQPKTEKLETDDIIQLKKRVQKLKQPIPKSENIIDTLINFISKIPTHLKELYLSLVAKLENILNYIEDVTVELFVEFIEYINKFVEWLTGPTQRTADEISIEIQDTLGVVEMMEDYVKK
jgi:hypothetical protein